MKEPFTTTGTIRRLFNDGRKKYGYAVTTEGEAVYVPAHLVNGISEGDVLEAKLKPSTDPRSKFYMAEICGVKQRNRRQGLIVYDRDRFNIVPPTGTRSSI